MEIQGSRIGFLFYWSDFMSLKQDRQGVRTATDLERKYNFNKNFEHILKVAENAQAAANEAKKNVTELDQNLTSYVDGKVDGVYKDIEATDSAMREYVDASDATNKAYVDNSIATANTYAVAKAKNAFYQTDANGNVSLSGISAYPTTAGVYRVISKVAGLPDDINGYGTLAIFNAGSYILNLYLDANGLLYYARTADGVAVPTSWKVCGGKRCIWNNPSPSADFASQKVSRDLSEYNFVSIKFAFHKTLNSYEYCWW